MDSIADCRPWCPRLKDLSRPVGDRNQRVQVATISDHNDAAIGEMVADGLEKVGAEGTKSCRNRSDEVPEPAGVACFAAPRRQRHLDGCQLYGTFASALVPIISAAC